MRSSGNFSKILGLTCCMCILGVAFTAWGFDVRPLAVRPTDDFQQAGVEVTVTILNDGSLNTITESTEFLTWQHVNGTSETVFANPDGTFTLNAPPGKVTLIIGSEQVTLTYPSAGAEVLVIVSNGSLFVRIQNAAATIQTVAHTTGDTGGDRSISGIGPCCEANGTPGCDDNVCELDVCSGDSFCCDIAWDATCAGAACDDIGPNCACCGGCPGGDGDECETGIAVGEGVFAGTTADNTGTTGDDTSCAFGDDIDEWYCYTAGCTGMATASTCGSPFDTSLAAFDGCGGAELACNDDTCGLQSTISWAVTEGETYNVRVSGFNGQSGDYTLDISCGGGGGDCDDEFCADVTPVQLVSGVPFTFTGNNSCNFTHECASFPIGEGHIWLPIILPAGVSDLAIEYCGSSGVWGNGWLNLAIGCPCADFSIAAAFQGFNCPDGNIQSLVWSPGLLVAGATYYYPLMHDIGLGADGDYNITFTAGAAGDCGNGECAGDETCDSCPADCGPCPPCAKGAGDCLNPAGNGTPGCDDINCCECICECDAFCCDVEWDLLCAGDGVNPGCGAGLPEGVGLCFDECQGIVPTTGGCCTCNGGESQCAITTEAECSLPAVYLGDESDCELVGGDSQSFSGNAMMAIPDVGAPTCHTINVTGVGAINDVNVEVNITHTWVGDLCVTLSRDGGAAVALVQRIGLAGADCVAGCCGADCDNLNVTLDDSAGSSIDTATCAAGGAISGTFIPHETLAGMIGADADVAWELCVDDNAAGDTGTLDNWTLIFEGEPGASPCDDAIECVETGACCVCDEGADQTVCEETTEGGCGDLGGIYQGNGTDCGPGGGLAHTAYPSGAVGLGIPDGGGPAVCHTISVPDGGLITDVDVEVNITHTWVGDLCVTLSHDGGTPVALVQRIGLAGADCVAGCCGADCDNLNVTLDDSAAASIDTAVCAAGGAISGTFIPHETLTAFNGLEALANWELCVDDNAAADTGTFDNWTLLLEAGPPPPGICEDIDACPAEEGCCVCTGSRCDGTQEAQNVEVDNAQECNDLGGSDGACTDNSCPECNDNADCPNGVCKDKECTGEADCGCCAGKVVDLCFQYDGPSGNIQVKAKKQGASGSADDIIFDEFVENGGTFCISPVAPATTLGKKIDMCQAEGCSGSGSGSGSGFCAGGCKTKIHTSCSKPIGPGLVAGDFTVISGTSLLGGDLCDADDPACDSGSGSGSGSDN